MTSEQVMLTLAALLVLLGGCDRATRPRGADPLVAPYDARRVWAVAPLRNESGSLQVDGASMADHLARQLEEASNLDVLPVNRTLAAMESLQMPAVSSPADATKLLAVLGADALLVGTVTAYDPYDPPKLGMSLELYTTGQNETSSGVDPRTLTSAAVERPTRGERGAGRPSQPATAISAFFDAADPRVRRRIQRYAHDRGATSRRDDAWFDNPLEKTDESWRYYRLSMDLYTEFVSYVMSWRLLEAERQRLAPAVAESSP